MRDWTKLFRSKTTVTRWNVNLANSLSHCLSLEMAGWHFRCVECHLSTGTYPTGHTSNWHSHNQYQIEIVVSGVFEFDSADSGTEKAVLRPGEALLIPWKHAHRFRCTKTGVMIGISLDLIPTPESIRQNGWLVTQFRKTNSVEVKQRTYELLHSGLTNEDSSLSARVNASLLFLLLAAIVTKAMPVSPDAEADSHSRAVEARGRETIGRIVKLMNDNLAAEVSLAQVSKEVGLSSRQIHRLFVRHVGKSLHDYLLELRLEEARKLIGMRNSELQIKEIAFACGFNSLSYFCTAFKRFYGVTPSSLLLPAVALKSGTTFHLFKTPEEALAKDLPNRTKKPKYPYP
ncbi:MAG: helix-turn-helix transcriptional regulator [Chthoniobacterales bacterium]|nr:helix-turn-helix transcriptional regulator [Chthoniobacterales bacterium]